MDRSNSKFMNITSPYSKYYKPRLRADQNELLTKRLGASKLTRKELENKYYDLCEENVIVKRENNENKEKIKHLTTKLLRLTSCSGRSIKPRELFTTDDTLKVRLIDLENKNSILKDQMKMMITKYGKKLSSLSIYSPQSFDTNRDEKMDTKREDKSEGSLTRKSHDMISIDNIFMMHDSPDSKKTERTDDGVVKLHCDEEELRAEQSRKIEKLQEEINALNSHLEETRQTNIELLKEISDLRTKWSEIDLSKRLAEDIKVIELNRCLEEAKNEMHRLKRYTEDIERDACSKLDRERQLTTELEAKLKTESDKSLDYTAKLERAQQDRQQLDELEVLLEQKNLEILALREQSNKFQAIANSSEEDGTKLQELIDLNEELKKQVENSASTSSSLEHSHANLLEKVKILQSHNDELIVELEGKKNENGYLKEQNEQLVCELQKLKKIQLELEVAKNSLCRKLAEYRKKSDINNFTIVEADAWSNKYPQISENLSPLIEKGSGDVCIPIECDYEIPVQKIISETKASFYSRPDYQKYSHRRTYRLENMMQTMQYKNRLDIFESPKLQLERAQNTRRALKYYRYYHNMINSTKVAKGREDDFQHADNFSDLSSIRNDECTDETIHEELSPDSPIDDDLSVSEQPTTTVSVSCQNGNVAQHLVKLKVNALEFVDTAAYSNVEIELINKADRKTKRFSLDSSSELQQQVYVDDGNKFNFLLIFSELNRNEFGFSIFQNEFEENRGGKMDFELDVYDIGFPHKILGKLFINIFT